MYLKHYLPFIILTFFSLSLFGQNTITTSNPESKEGLAERKKSYPIIFKFDTLFYIQEGNAGFSAELRAKKISKRIRRLGKDFSGNNDTLYLREGKKFIDIMFNHDLAFTITNADAKAAGKPIEEISNQALLSFSTALLTNKYNLSVTEWLKRVSYTLLSLIVLLTILWGINFIFKRIETHLVKFDRKLLKKRNNLFKYFIPKNTENIFVFFSHSIKVVLIVFILFFFLPLLFSFLPWTQGLVNVFYGYIETPVLYAFHGIIAFIPHLFFIIVIFYITRYFVRVMHDMFDDIRDEKLKFKNFPPDWANPTRKLVSVIIYAFGLVLVFPHLPGSNSPAFKGVSLFLGVLFSLGSTSAIANMVAGIVITYMRPFQIGDRVQVMVVVGDVIEKTLLITRLRTSKNEDVTIPNASVISNHLINFSANANEIGLILHTNITLGYDIPWVDVEKYLLKAAKNTKLLQRDPKPFVLQTSLDDYYVTYELNVYTKQPKKTPLIMSDLNRNILDVFDDLGIEILSPKYVASRDGNTSTVPSQNGVDFRNPIEKIADHLTGKNQKNKIETTEKKPVKKPVKKTVKKEK